jgi:MFS transporter, SP family, sugar:H+ symporter
MAPHDTQTASSRSSATIGATEDVQVPEIPNKEAFDDDSKVPFLTMRTFAMTCLVSMGGICFGYDTGQISGFLEVRSRSQFCFGSANTHTDAELPLSVC